MLLSRATREFLSLEEVLQASQLSFHGLGVASVGRVHSRPQPRAPRCLQEIHSVSSPSWNTHLLRASNATAFIDYAAELKMKQRLNKNTVFGFATYFLLVDVVERERLKEWRSECLRGEGRGERRLHEVSQEPSHSQCSRRRHAPSSPQRCVFLWTRTSQL